MVTATSRVVGIAKRHELERLMAQYVQETLMTLIDANSALLTGYLPVCYPHSR
jgi:hypothetical protein